MNLLWYCRNAKHVVFLLAPTEDQARAAAFSVWNEDPDEVRDVTEAFGVAIGPLIGLLRDRVPAPDGKGQLFRWRDPQRAIAYWLGDDSGYPCPHCGTDVAPSEAMKSYEPLAQKLERLQEQIADVRLENSELKAELVPAAPAAIAPSP